MKKTTKWALALLGLAFAVGFGMWAQSLFVKSELVHFSVNFPSDGRAETMSCCDLGGPWSRDRDPEWDDYAAGGLPERTAHHDLIVSADTVAGRLARVLIQLPMCEKRRISFFRFHVLCQNEQILKVYDAVAQRGRADITQGVAFAPVVSQNRNIFHINETVAVKIDDGQNRCFP